MRRTIISLAFVFISICATSQQYLTFPISQKDSFRFNWKPLEKRVSRSDTYKFIQDHPKDFEAYRDRDEPSYGRPNIDSLYNDLHFLDINGDGINDIVFDGESGGEPRLIEIYINQGKTYKKVFSEMQGVVKMDWQGGRLSRIFIRDWGCCDAYLEFHKIYNVKFDDKGIPTFDQIYQAASVYEGAVPDSILETPFRFEVINQGYNIRSAPIKDDSSMQYWNNEGEKRKGNGNSIGLLVKAAKGIALAKTVDNTGREWLYVDIDEGYLFPANNIIYKENKFPTKLTGWISSRYIKIL